MQSPAGGSERAEIDVAANERAARCGLFCKGVIHAWSGRSAEAGTQAILDQMLSSESLVEPNCICVNSCIDTWAKRVQVQGTQHFAETDGRIESAARKRAFAS